MTMGLRGKPSRSAEIVAFLRAFFSLQGAEPRLQDYHAVYFLRSWSLRLLYGACLIPGGYATLDWGFKHFLGGSHLHIAFRTLYIDAVLERWASNHGGQLVILGAGYDTRAFRFNTLHPSLRCAELDLEQTQSVKRAVLGQHPSLRDGAIQMVPADVTDAGWIHYLNEAGLTPERPSLFIAEGLIPYLTRVQVESLFQSIAAFGAQSFACGVVFTYLAEERSRNRSGLVRRLLSWFHIPTGEKFSSTFTLVDLSQVLAQAGFILEEDVGFTELHRLILPASAAPKQAPVPFRIGFAVLRSVRTQPDG